MITFIKHAKNRINRNSAFTLAEALVAVLIMLMVTVIVAAGIPAASRAYRNVVDVSNAEVLMSTAMNTLRNELGLAKNVVIEDGNKITYYNESYNTYSRITVDDSSENGIMYERFANDIDSDKYFGIDIYVPEGGSKPERLVSKEASNGDMYIKYDEITPSHNKVVIFKNLAVYKEGRSAPLVERETFSIRVISA